MRSYRIVSGFWTNVESTKAVLFVVELENEVVVNSFSYGYDANDQAPVSLQLKALLQADASMVGNGEEVQVLNGEIPVPEGMVIFDGKVTAVLFAKEIMRKRIKARINELYSGYDQALAERNPVYARNRKRKIDNLLKMEVDPDLSVDMSLEEDNISENI